MTTNNRRISVPENLLKDAWAMLETAGDRALLAEAHYAEINTKKCIKMANRIAQVIRAWEKQR